MKQRSNITKQAAVKRKYSHAEASAIADAVVEHLQKFCEKIDIAGSVRREAAFSEDIDIVLRPVHIWSTFDRELMRDPEWHKAMRSLGIMIEGKSPKPLSQRRSCKIILPWANGIQVDIAIPQESDYGRLLAIRTGNDNYAFKILATKWSSLDWCGTADGLRRKHDCIKRGKIWVCTNPIPEMPPVFDTEEAFFKFLGLNWISPKLRVL